MSNETYEIFLACAPGLEPVLRDEARALGFDKPACVPGGVTIRGGWRDVWRANLDLRGAGRVSVSIGGFRAMHLAQLDKRARKFPWGDVLRRDVPVKVEAICRKSRIYHDKAAAQRVERALDEAGGIPVSKDAAITLRCRIEDDFCTFSIDTSGALLHKRGHKEAVGKAPMRETLASLFLRQCGYTGAEPVIDPMCGSGTFVIEAAEMALGLKPGRSRGFAFEQLLSFDPDAWEAMKTAQPARDCAFKFRGSDRDQGAVTMSRQNAARAGVSEVTEFAHHALGDLQRPDGPPGLVIVNPPYGGRIGNKKLLYALHASLGQVMKERFAGWRLGIITNEAGFARATGLDLQTGPPVAHGGLKVRLFQARIPG